MRFIEVNAKKEAVKKYDINYPTMDNLQNAGLLLNENTVLIDFDGDNGVKEQYIIEYLKNNFPTLNVTTDRGEHFYYKKPKNTTIKSNSDVITVTGFQVDYKTGNNAYAVVKLNGIERKRNQDLTFTDLPELPYILYPLDKNKTNLSNMYEGDGRNDSIFKHLCNVRRKYRTLDIENIAEFINNNIFAEPLKDRELNNTINSVLSRTPETTKNEFKPLDFISATDLKNKELKPIKFIVNKLLPQGLNILCSPPKYRKKFYGIRFMFECRQWTKIFKSYLQSKWLFIFSIRGQLQSIKRQNGKSSKRR